MISQLLSLSEAEIKKPENKSIFSDDAFYVEIFKNGELEAKKLYPQIQIKAMQAKATRIFNSKYEQHRKNLLIEKSGVNEFQQVDIYDFPKLKLPPRYKFDINKGILMFNENACEFEAVFPQIVIIEERYINIDTGEEKNKISFLDRLKKKSLVVDAETISNTKSITKLRNMGILATSENAKYLVGFLSEFLGTNIYDIEPKHSISRIGWNDDKFVPYDESCVFDGELENKPLFDSVSEKGDFDEWVDYTRELRKNKPLRLQMAASYASPLIELTGSLPFVFHLWGGTGSGKTVGLMVSMSIWGNPAMGKLVRTMNMTQNSMMTTAAFLYSVPFAGDELQIIKNRWHGYDNLIMAVTEGVDRGRMEGHVNKKLKNWNCNFLFTGEEPCTTSRSGGGTKNRVIELECTEKVVDNGNEVVNFVKENYGLAGKKFVEAVKNYDIQEEFSRLNAQLIAESSSTEKQSMSLSLILLADKIACEQIYGDEPLKAKDVSHMLKNESDVDVTERAFQYTVDWISVNQQSFSREKEELVSYKQVYGRVDRNNDNIVFVVNSVLKRELEEQGYSMDACTSKWREKGYLLPNSQGRNLHSTKINGQKATCYKVNLESFITDEDRELEYEIFAKTEAADF